VIPPDVIRATVPEFGRPDAGLHQHASYPTNEECGFAVIGWFTRILYDRRFALCLILGTRLPHGAQRLSAALDLFRGVLAEHSVCEDPSPAPPPRDGKPR
jgi:hypothetical protein